MNVSKFILLVWTSALLTGGMFSAVLAQALPSNTPPPPPPPDAVPEKVLRALAPDVLSEFSRQAPGARASNPHAPDPLEFSAEERIVLLGDSLLEDEEALGYLETRLSVQFPEKRVTVRNLSKPANQLLRDAQGRADLSRATPEWTSKVAAAVHGLRPTLVILGYGSDSARAGEERLSNFTNVLTQLAGQIAKRPGPGPERLVLLGPVPRKEDPAPGNGVNLSNLTTFRYDEAVGAVAGGGFRFVELRAILVAGMARAAQPEPGGSKPPSLFTEQGRLTPYAYHLLCQAWEGRVAWKRSNWRFGLLPNNQGMRGGGFGMTFHRVERSDRHARVEATEDRLPMPNPPGFVDRAENFRPQCYIQIPGLTNGTYAWVVDGKKVVTGTESEWGRYEVIAEGPAWDQAEEVRQLIVKKNQAAAPLLESVLANAKAGQAGGGAQDPKLADQERVVRELEARIEAMRKPKRRVMELQAVAGPSAER